MLKVVSKSYVKTDKIEEFLDISRELIEYSKEDYGNISYELYQDIEKPYVLTFIQKWQDIETLQIHMNTNHYNRLVPQLEALQQKKTTINMYKRIDFDTV